MWGCTTTSFPRKSSMNPAYRRWSRLLACTPGWMELAADDGPCFPLQLGSSVTPTHSLSVGLTTDMTTETSITWRSHYQIFATLSITRLHYKITCSFSLFCLCSDCPTSINLSDIPAYTSRHLSVPITRMFTALSDHTSVVPGPHPTISQNLEWWYKDKLFHLKTPDDIRTYAL